MNADSLFDRTVVSLLQARGSADAIKGLYLLRKSVNKSFSLTKICRVSGIRSKGYLSDVMRGRRVLTREYAEPLAAALGLRGLTAKFLRTLVALDLEKSLAKRRQLSDSLAVSRKALAIRVAAVPRPLRCRSLEFEVFCAFGLFKGAPKLDDLLGYFGHARRKDVEAAIDVLVQSGYVERSPGKMTLLVNEIRFDKSTTGSGHLTFLRDAISDAAKKSTCWFSKTRSSCFDSAIISVRREEYERALIGLKADLLQWQAELETASADMLVRFNVQVYPVS